MVSMGKVGLLLCSVAIDLLKQCFGNAFSDTKREFDIIVQQMDVIRLDTRT